MNSVENLEKIAATLRDAGYDVQPDQRYLDSLADRMRAAGWTVTAPDTDPAGDKAAADDAARAENERRQGPAATGITPNGPSDPAKAPGDGDQRRNASTSKSTSGKQAATPASS
jgi:hypothetical protein